jgi:hypothetical protein
VALWQAFPSLVLRGLVLRGLVLRAGWQICSGPAQEGFNGWPTQVTRTQAGEGCHATEISNSEIRVSPSHLCKLETKGTHGTNLD